MWIRCLLALAIGLSWVPPSLAAEPPRLAVLVVFDQLRGDYPARWADLFGEGGFRRLAKDGAWFQDCHYPYAHTVTGAGHASLSTGAYPSQHGIVGNEWFDRAAGDTVYCVGSERYARVPATLAETDKKGSKYKGIAPERLLLPTLGDALKSATGGKGKVVSLSFKDRGAVPLGGSQPDACYWLDSDQLVTSTYYRDQLHPWVAEFNRSRPADAWYGKDWTRLRTDLDYERYCGPDDVVGEGKGVGQGLTFPHPLTGGQAKLGKDYYKAFYNSPFGNELLLDLARRAIDAEKLGSRDVPDLLCISFSCNDPVGHSWGPDSQEVLDVTLRADRILKDLLAYLDARVGKGRYLLALSADHGICPLPEVSRSKGRDGNRLDPVKLRREANRFLDETYGTDKAMWFETSANAEETFYPWIYLNRRLLGSHNLKSSAVEEALAGWLAKQPGIQTAYTRTQLLGELPRDDVLGQMVRRSFHPARSGDVAIVVKPFSFVSKYLTGTTHGSPHPYDTHVPLFVYGPGIRAGIRQEAVIPQAAAVILARGLGIKPPSGAEATVPDNLFSSTPER